MLENFVLVTSLRCWLPIYNIGKVTKRILSPISSDCHYYKVTDIKLSPTSLDMIERLRVGDYLAFLNFWHIPKWISQSQMTSERLFETMWIGFSFIWLANSSIIRFATKSISSIMKVYQDENPCKDQFDPLQKLSKNHFDPLLRTSIKLIFIEKLRVWIKRDKKIDEKDNFLDLHEKSK